MQEINQKKYCGKNIPQILGANKELAFFNNQIDRYIWSHTSLIIKQFLLPDYFPKNN
jgi:hypothetical protein